MARLQSLIVKALGYRGLVLAGELLLALLLARSGLRSLVTFVLIDNALKVVGYMLYDLLWEKRLGGGGANRLQRRS